MFEASTSRRLKSNWSNDMAIHQTPDDARGNGLRLHDAGLGGIRPDQVVGLGPHDAGLGGIRPDSRVRPAERHFQHLFRW
jgi:hypothetical protein